jgi:hypothetical protein
MFPAIYQAVWGWGAGWGVCPATIPQLLFHPSLTSGGPAFFTLGGLGPKQQALDLLRRKRRSAAGASPPIACRAPAQGSLALGLKP